LIEVSATLSNRIVKKGDYFSIYIDITNGHEDPINITQVRLFQPVGFIPVKVNKLPATIFEAIRNFFRESGVQEIDRSTGGRENQVPNIQWRPPPPPPTEEPKPNGDEPAERVIGPSIVHSSNGQIVQPKAKYREDFNLKAGWTGGLRPRPDTYAISAEVTYEVKNVSWHKQITIDVSIFPSLSSMLFGALFGSILGTVVKALVSPGTPNIFAALFTNLVLAFIIAVTLMRKKDVQPFLTIEDFWGGILLGFLVGTNGQTFLDTIMRLSSQGGTMLGV
jgi:hypothetical protein